MRTVLLLLGISFVVCLVEVVMIYCSARYGSTIVKLAVRPANQILF